MSATAQQLPSKTVSEEANGSISYVGKLDEGELLTGTPTIDAVTGLTFSNIAVNIIELQINGKTVPIGMAVQFKVTGGVAGVTYTIPVSCGTNSTPAQTRRGKCLLEVESDA